MTFLRNSKIGIKVFIGAGLASALFALWACKVRIAESDVKAGILGLSPGCYYSSSTGWEVSPTAALCSARAGYYPNDIVLWIPTSGPAVITRDQAIAAVPN